MKSKAFKKAWELFRKFEMTFSQALIEGWKFVKREWLKAEFATTTGEEITYRAKLSKRYNELKETVYSLRNFIPVTYGKGIYNAIPKGIKHESWMSLGC